MSDEALDWNLVRFVRPVRETSENSKHPDLRHKLYTGLTGILALDDDKGTHGIRDFSKQSF
jgi:hypothetical protein